MKRFLSILLALVMVLSLVACGNKTTPDTPDTPDKQEETIHIGIVTGSVSQSFFSLPSSRTLPSSR